jgi:preprotein translocase subunit SecF
VVLTLFALYLFGGASIKTFVLALLIGIISGTYSSLFNASMLLVIWENREWRRFFGGGRSETPARPAARSTAR